MNKQTRTQIQTTPQHIPKHPNSIKFLQRYCRAYPGFRIVFTIIFYSSTPRRELRTLSALRRRTRANGRYTLQCQSCYYYYTVIWHWVVKREHADLARTGVTSSTTIFLPREIEKCRWFLANERHAICSRTIGFRQVNLARVGTCSWSERMEHGHGAHVKSGTADTLRHYLCFCCATNHIVKPKTLRFFTIKL